MIPLEMTTMWTSTKCKAMAIAAAALAGPVPAECRNSHNGAEYRNSGYAGAYVYGWPATTYDVAGYGLSGTYGYGGPYRAASNGLDNGQGPSPAAALMPERTRAIVRRRGPKRLE
jgi:hypothetical protein